MNQPLALKALVYHEQRQRHIETCAVCDEDDDYDDIVLGCKEGERLDYEWTRIRKLALMPNAELWKLPIKAQNAISLETGLVMIGHEKIGRRRVKG